MTLTFCKLQQFIIELKQEGYNLEISNNELELKIGKKFGLSIYTLKNIKWNLNRFGFISDKGNGIWVIKNGIQ